MRKYTWKCEFPRAEIHAERCITACGNTLNQVPKNSRVDMPHVTSVLCFVRCKYYILFDETVRS